MMKSRRYILTQDADKKSKLWSLESGTCVKDFGADAPNEAKAKVDRFDNYLNRNGWVNFNVNLGVLAANIDLPKWNNILIEDGACRAPESLVGPHCSKADPKSQLSLGRCVADKCFKNLDEELLNMQKDNLKTQLGFNFQDYLDI